MAGVYLDTSALGRVLLAEPGAAAIRARLGRYRTWWSSDLLMVELRRLAARERVATAGEQLLSGVRLLPLGTASLLRASRIEPIAVRSLDAIHLEAALRLGGRGEIAAVMTYDRQLRVGCAHHGLETEAP